MVDKSIGALTEVGAIGVNDYLVIETAAGNTRKVRRGAVSLGGHKQPTMIQKATLRNDGTITLPAPPTVGNLMVHIQGGFSTYPAYTPAGFINTAIYSSNANNFAVASVRRVIAGDTGSYALSASDNQFCALYEYQDAMSVLGLAGGPMAFSGTNYALSVPRSPFAPLDDVIVVLEHDGTAVFTTTAETGLTKDYEPASDGANHIGAIYRCNFAAGFDGAFAGTSSGSLIAPVYGAFAIVGDFV